MPGGSHFTCRSLPPCLPIGLQPLLIKLSCGGPEMELSTGIYTDDRMLGTKILAKERVVLLAVTLGSDP